MKSLTQLDLDVLRAQNIDLSNQNESLAAEILRLREALAYANDQPFQTPEESTPPPELQEELKCMMSKIQHPNT